MRPENAWRLRAHEQRFARQAAKFNPCAPPPLLLSTPSHGLPCRLAKFRSRWALVSSISGSSFWLGVPESSCSCRSSRGCPRSAVQRCQQSLEQRCSAARTARPPAMPAAARLPRPQVHSASGFAASPTYTEKPLGPESQVRPASQHGGITVGARFRHGGGATARHGSARPTDSASQGEGPHPWPCTLAHCTHRCTACARCRGLGGWPPSRAAPAPHPTTPRCGNRCVLPCPALPEACACPAMPCMHLRLHRHPHACAGGLVPSAPGSRSAAPCLPRPACFL